MRIGQLDPKIRKAIIKGGRYEIKETIVIDNKTKVSKFTAYKCIGTYGHIVTLQQETTPHLTKSFTWFDMWKMVVEKKIKKIGYEPAPKRVKTTVA